MIERYVYSKQAKQFTIIKVSPGVMCSENQFVVVKYGKTVHNVCTQAGVNIIRFVFAASGTVPRPVSEVANNLMNIKKTYRVKSKINPTKYHIHFSEEIFNMKMEISMKKCCTA